MRRAITVWAMGLALWAVAAIPAVGQDAYPPVPTTTTVPPTMPTCEAAPSFVDLSQLRGEGWAPNSTVVVNLNTTSLEFSETVVTDEEGVFERISGFPFQFLQNGSCEGTDAAGNLVTVPLQIAAQEESTETAAPLNDVQRLLALVLGVSLLGLGAVNVVAHRRFGGKRLTD